MQRAPGTAEVLETGWTAAVAAGQWPAAAEHLNGFNDTDIATHLKLLNRDQLIWLYTAALGSLNGISQQRVLDPIGRQDIEAAYQACSRTAHWARTATVLNGFNDPDIAAHIHTLSPEQAKQLLNATPIPLTRVRRPLLETGWTAAVAAGQWPAAAEHLNGFNDSDVATHLQPLSIDQTLALRGAAAPYTRLITLIQIGSTSFTNTTDTGNAYTSNATILRNGILISKDVNYISIGSFGPGGFLTLQNRLATAVTSYLTGKYALRVGPPGGGSTAGDGDYPITVRVLPNSAASYPVNLRGGQHGRSAMSSSGGNVYELGMPTESIVPDIVLAHESAHMVLGASDEYANASVPGRVVTSDHSLMGNFYTQGIAAAQLKARNLQFLVRLAGTWFPGRTISIV